MAKIGVQFNQATSKVQAQNNIDDRMINFFVDGTTEGFVYRQIDDSYMTFTSDEHILDPTNDYADQIGVTWSGSAITVKESLEELKTSIDVIPASETETNIMSTGYVEGCTLSINADPTKFDMTSGVVYFCDTESDSVAPTFTEVAVAAQTAVTPSYTASATASTISIKIDGDIQQGSGNTPPTMEDFRNFVYIGAVVHIGTTIIATENATRTINYSPTLQIADLWEAIGFINYSGNVFSGNGATLGINKSSGDIAKGGINSHAAAPNDAPNKLFMAAVTSGYTTVYESFRDGVGGFKLGTTPTSVINPGSYDNNSGGTTEPGGNVSNNSWSNRRIYLFPNGIINVVFGQEVYGSLSEAQDALFVEDFDKWGVYDAALFRGWITLKGNATDLTNTAQAIFIAADKFGSAGVSGGGGGSLQDLQSSYNNSTQPQIEINATLGAFQVQGHSSVTNVSETLNSSAATILTVRNDGNVKIGTTALTQMLDVPVYPDLQIGDGVTSVYMSLKAGSFGAAFYSCENDLRNWISGIGVNGDFEIVDKTAAKVRLIIETNGDVGLGTDSALHKLHVKKDDTTTDCTILADQDGLGDASVGFDVGASQFMIGIDNSDSDKFKISGNITDLGSNTFLTIDSTGNVGITNNLTVNATSTTAISTSDNTFIVDTTNNRVGIGVSPSTELDVAGEVKSETATIEGAAPALNVTATGTGVDHDITGASGAGGFLIQVDKNSEGSSPYFELRMKGVNSLKIDQNRSLQLAAYGAGTLVTDSSGVVTASSDISLKENINPFVRGLGAIKGLKPSLFSWTRESGYNTDDINAGFIAQEVEEMIPEAVNGDDGSKTLLDRPIIAALVNAVKELSEKIERLEGV